MGQTASSLRAGSGSRFGVGSGNFRCPPPLQSTNIPLVVFVKDEVPTDFDWRSPLRYWGQQRPLLATLLPPRSRSQVTYIVRPLRRDAFRFGAVHARLSTPLQFCWLPKRWDLPQTVRVLPNLSQARKYLLPATQNAVAGIRFFRRRSTYLNRPKREMVSLIGDDEPTAVFSRLARIFLSLAKEAAALTS